MPIAEGIVASARHLADEVLFPDAMRIDRLDVLPVSHLDALAAAGLYGAPAPADAGGLGLDLAEVGLVVEELAGGCLAAAFVLVQHFRLAVRDGGHAVAVDQHAQRLAREAVFLLVFGSRPGIKHALLQLLGATVRAG
jgi:alkylation response protein AidB-like acyl-CoA dehydrogenase